MSGVVRFAKMSGAGNDFIVVEPDRLPHTGEDLTAWVRSVCVRGLSVGADGVLVVEQAEGAERVKVSFYNPDGSPAFCANGSRCAARYAFLRSFAGGRMVLETIMGEVPAEIAGEAVRLRLPLPVDAGPRTLDLPGGPLEGRYVTAGAPHFVSWTDNLCSAELARLGPPVRRHPEFGAAGVNFDLISKRPDGSLGIRTWERGVEGETLSCGSGAVAAALVNSLAGGGERVRILPAGGIPLEVGLSGDEATLEGDARLVYRGEQPICPADGPLLP